MRLRAAALLAAAAARLAASTCPAASWACGRADGVGYLAARAGTASRAACMDACTAHTRCEAAVWHESGAHALQCYLLAEPYDAYFVAADGAFAANRPYTTGGLASCADSSAAVTCCVAHYSCRSASAAAASSSAQTSAEACAAACAAATGCLSVVWQSDGTCELHNSYGAADRDSQTAWAADMPASTAACTASSAWTLGGVGVSGSSGGTGCTACTAAAYLRCGRSPAPARVLGIPAVAEVPSLSACMRLCGGSPGCKAVEYRYRSAGPHRRGLCQQLLHGAGAADDAAEELDYWVVERPFASPGTLATCTTVPEGPPCGAPCGVGWHLGPSDGYCYKAHGGDAADPALAPAPGSGASPQPGAPPPAAPHPEVGWVNAQRVCAAYGRFAGLAVVANETQMEWLVRLLGPSRAAWIGIRHQGRAGAGANESNWVLPGGRVADYLPWDPTVPEPRGGCAALFTRAAPSGTGGLNLWRAEPCGRKLGFVCARPLRPVEILSVHGVPVPPPGPPYGVPPAQGQLPPTSGIPRQPPQAEVIEIEPNEIVITGRNFHDQLWVSLQTTNEEYHPRAPGQPTGCDGRLPLLGAATPFRLLNHSYLEAELPPLYTGDERWGGNQTEAASFYVPFGWPLVVGWNYSVCWAEGVPHPEPAEPRQYSNDAGVVLTVVREFHRRQRDICARRNERVAAVYSYPAGGGPPAQ